MKNVLMLVSFLLLTFETAKAQTNQTATKNAKEISLTEIWNGTFSAERMNALNSMNGDF